MKYYIIAIILFFTLFSCMLGPQVISQADTGYSGKVSNLLILSNFRTKKGAFRTENVEFYEYFRLGIEAKFDELGIQNRCEVYNEYGLDEPDIKSILNESHPDTILTIEQGETIIDQYMQEVQATYIVKIISIDEDKEYLES